MSTALIVTAIGSLIATLGSGYAVIQSRKKVDVEVDSIIVTSAEKSVELGLRQLEWAEREVNRLRGLLHEERERNKAMEDLVIEVRELKAEVKELKKELALRPTRDDLKDTIKELRTQLRGLGQTPSNGDA